MLLKEVMIKDFGRVHTGDKRPVIAEEMIKHDASFVLVVNNDDSLAGLITGADLRKLIVRKTSTVNVSAKEIMTPVEKLTVFYPDDRLEEVMPCLGEKNIPQVPVINNNGNPVGVITSNIALKHISEKAVTTETELNRFKLATSVINSMVEGLVVVDRNYIIREFNPAAERISGCKSAERMGKAANLLMKKDTPVRRVMESGEPLYNVEVKDYKTGKTLLTNNVPIYEDSKMVGVVQTVIDISKLKEAEYQLIETKEELDKAFALTLPDSRVESKLKSSPEYRDNFDPDTGLITITGVLLHGCYIHVVNALKVAADLNEIGVFHLVGMDKDLIVKAIIYHDIGKSQPLLKVGDVVDPRTCFEDGRVHAKRSAEIIDRFYDHQKDLVNLVRYHHHSEDELPSDFPSYLMPLLRVFQIIDGISAGMTRRMARCYFELDGTHLTVTEKNEHPYYNRGYTLDVYTGMRSFFNKSLDDGKFKGSEYKLG